MDAVVLVLCIALALVTLTALIGGGVKLKRSSDALKAESETQPPAQSFAVKQKAGEVKVAYLVEKNEGGAQEEVAVAAPVPAPAPAPQPKEEPAPVAEVRQDGVLLPKTEKLTFEEKYARLPEENKKYLDEFVAHIKSKEDCEARMQTSALALRYKKEPIAKAVIRRDVAVLNFPIANPELGRMVREEKIKSVKLQPAEIRLTTEEELTLAKQTADITLDYLKEEEEYKAEKRREARREAAKKKRESEGGQA